MSHDDKLELLHEEKNRAFEVQDQARKCRNRAQRRLSHIEEIIDRGVDDVPLLYLQEAKDKLSWAEERLSDAQASYEQAKMEFAQARKKFDEAKLVLDREIARRAGIGSRYLDSEKFKVSENEDGLYDIYFGGANGDPNDKGCGRYIVKPGDGHGHYVVEYAAPIFKVVWRRKPRKSRKSLDATVTSQSKQQ